MLPHVRGLIISSTMCFSTFRVHMYVRKYLHTSLYMMYILSPLGMSLVSLNKTPNCRLCIPATVPTPQEGRRAWASTICGYTMLLRATSGYALNAKQHLALIRRPIPVSKPFISSLWGFFSGLAHSRHTGSDKLSKISHSLPVRLAKGPIT